MPASHPVKVQSLVLVLGDQLDAAALAAANPAQDAVLMIETAAEARRAWSHRQRIALFIAGMRHLRDRLHGEGWRVIYHELADAVPDLGTGLREALEITGARRVLVIEPGEWRVEQEIATACDTAGVALELVPDRHFYCARSEFTELARGRARYTMEQFYRHMRRRHGVLLDDGKPCGGSWNFDTDNRAAFGRAGPPPLPAPGLPAPEALTRAVLAEVAQRFPDHPGSLRQLPLAGDPRSGARAARALHPLPVARLRPPPGRDVAG
jgi:deoxyribodipyrimidine photolyase-related protein